MSISRKQCEMINLLPERGGIYRLGFPLAMDIGHSFPVRRKSFSQGMQNAMKLKNCTKMIESSTKMEAFTREPADETLDAVVEEPSCSRNNSNDTGTDTMGDTVPVTPDAIKNVPAEPRRSD